MSCSVCCQSSALAWWFCTLNNDAADNKVDAVGLYGHAGFIEKTANSVLALLHYTGSMSGKEAAAFHVG